MIDETVKKGLFAAIQRILAKWSEELVFEEPRPRYAVVAQGAGNGTYYAFSIMAGENEQEISQMVDEIKLLHDKFIPPSERKRVRERFGRGRI